MLDSSAPARRRGIAGTLIDTGDVIALHRRNAAPAPEDEAGGEQEHARRRGAEQQPARRHPAPPLTTPSAQNLPASPDGSVPTGSELPTQSPDGD